MEVSDLVGPRRVNLAGLAVLAALVAASGCHGGAAGGRRSDGTDAEAESVPKLPPPDADCPADAMGGGGTCPLNFCGAPQAVSVLPVGALPDLGADALCTPGYACVPDGATASGDGLQLRCVQVPAAAENFGAACAKGASATNRCSNDALCIQAASAPGQPFCSTLCRADADCPIDAYCLEYKSDPLPKGSYVNLGFCTPKAKIPGTACTREADCPTDQGCVAAGARTNLLTCQNVGGAKSIGDLCTDPAQCRSGQCFDRAFHVAADGAAGNRSYCSGACAKSSDCGADQRCARVVLNNNGTPADPRDDLVMGLCQTLFVPVTADGCHADADCMADGGTGDGDTCATKYGLCYKAGAASGAPCAKNEGCDLGAQCVSDRFPGGYCQTFGCAPGAAVGGVDSCPGATATCSQQGADFPLHVCYEGCMKSGDCTRLLQSYQCEAPTSDAGATPSICIYDKGV